MAKKEYAEKIYSDIVQLTREYFDAIRNDKDVKIYYDKAAFLILDTVDTEYGIYYILGEGVRMYYDGCEVYIEYLVDNTIGDWNCIDTHSIVLYRYIHHLIKKEYSVSFTKSMVSRAI